jgi:hypothetical protein
VGDRTDVAVEQIGMFYGLGAAIILLAAMAAGRFSVVGIRDVALAPAHTERVGPAYDEPIERPVETPVARPVENTGVMHTPERVEQPVNRDVDLTDGATPETTETPVGAHRHRRFSFR